MSTFSEHGISVYALSYDEPDALRDFRDAHNLSFTLLSDPQSEVIRSFGILNTLINEDDHPWFGIPYPGSYVIDSAGVITHKFFDSNLAVRAGPEQLLRASLGQRISQADSADASSSQADTPDSVAINVFLDGDGLTPTVQKDLVVHFDVPAHRHVYAAPAPQGSVAAELVLEDDPRLVKRKLQAPASEPHKLSGTDEEFRVHHGSFELRLPLTINSAVSKDDQTIALNGHVIWQSCDDEVCDIPSREPFSITVPVGRAPAVALGNPAGMQQEPNAMAHFQKMTSRRQSDQ